MYQFCQFVQAFLVFLRTFGLTHILNKLLCARRIVHGLMLNGAETVVKHLVHDIQAVFLVTEFSAG